MHAIEAFDNWLFSETQGRFIVTEPHDSHAVTNAAAAAGVVVTFLGWTAGETIQFVDIDGNTHADILLADLRAAHEGFFLKLMGADAALA